MILGFGHLERKECGRDNVHISSRFLASLLDSRVPKLEEEELLVRLFRKGLVGGVEEVIKSAILGTGISRPNDLMLLWETDEAVKFNPFLLDLSGVALMCHRMIVAVVVEYLKKMLSLIVASGFKWIRDFESFARLNGFLKLVKFLGFLKITVVVLFENV